MYKDMRGIELNIGDTVGIGYSWEGDNFISIVTVTGFTGDSVNLSDGDVVPAKSLLVLPNWYLEGV